MNKLTNQDYERLENYWRYYAEIFKGIPYETDANVKEESERIVQVIGEQYEQMDEETQGAFNMAMLASIDVEEAEGFPLSLETLEQIKKRTLQETARRLAVY